ncbi:MAG: gluconokinase [Rhodoferax sp.]|nr:gluconokinase [Rhodoferax sp.]
MCRVGRQAKLGTSREGVSELGVTPRPRPILVVMGVSGCGKSTVAAALARTLGLPMLEGDDWHTPASVAKMAAGIPLTDADRAGWLDQLAEQLASHGSAGTGCVLACSALRRCYRDRLRSGAPAACFVYLHGGRELLAQRLAMRKEHYMPASLLDSQLATLELPQPDEHAVCLDIIQSPPCMVAAVQRVLG